MDIISLAILTFVFLFLMELSFVAREPSSKMFWAFLAFVAMLTTVAQTIHDGNIVAGTDTIPLDLALDFALFILLLIPLMRVYSIRNP